MMTTLSFRKLTQRIVLVAAAVVLTACPAKKKPEEAAPTGTEDSTISSNPMSFNIQGSDSGQIPGLTTVNFEYDSSNITERGKQILNENANWLKTNSKITVQIEGHCDERGSIEYNLALGERRAKAVKAYLTSVGVDGKQLTIISFGEEKKLAEGDTEEVHVKNRRANFVPLPN